MPHDDSSWGGLTDSTWGGAVPASDACWGFLVPDTNWGG